MTKIKLIGYSDENYKLLDEELKRVAINLRLPKNSINKVLFGKNLLDPRTSKWAEAAKRFEQADLPNMVLLEVYEIYAWKLQQNYLVHKRFLQNQYSEHTNILNRLERVVYHGTKELNVMKILADGFNPIFASREPEHAAFGQGCYFARDLSYSAGDDFSKPNKFGHKFVFIVRLLVGATFTVFINFARSTNKLIDY